MTDTSKYEYIKDIHQKFYDRFPKIQAVLIKNTAPGNKWVVDPNISENDEGREVGTNTAFVFSDVLFKESSLLEKVWGVFGLIIVAIAFFTSASWQAVILPALIFLFTLYAITLIKRLSTIVSILLFYSNGKNLLIKRVLLSLKKELDENPLNTPESSKILYDRIIKRAYKDTFNIYEE